MVRLLQLFLAYRLKVKQPIQKNGGFTLIELLVGLLLALLVILPLLGFVVNMLQTDRQEQAKANSEQEIQAAVDYIARDLEQAVWIYDGYGLNQIKDKLPQLDNSTPVLVFWKRQIVPKIISTGRADEKDDAFVYALVAYYLTKSDPTTCATDIWSCTSRISRIQLRDALEKDDVGNPINTGDEGKDASPGFRLFDPRNSTSVENSMNAWQSDNRDITSSSNQPQVLIDYIDDTPTRAADLAPACSAMQRTSALPDGTPAATYNASNYQLVPYDGATDMLTGFFACVNVEKTAAQVFIRGNALARLRKKGIHPKYIASQSSYFPSGSVQIQGRGVFTINRQGQ